MKKQKDQETVSIDLKKTPDILKYAGDHSTGMYIVGFAAETENVEQYAQDKLERKNADCIVMNDVSDTSIGMNSPDNEVVMLFREGAPVPFEKMDKRALGEQIIDTLIQRWLG